VPRKRIIIKFVYFDLGWVIIPVDTESVSFEFAKHSELPLSRIKEVLLHEYNKKDTEYCKLAHSFDKGLIYPEEFHKKICQTLKMKLDFEEFLKIWKMMVGLDNRFVKMNRNLQDSNIRTGIISDLSIVHYDKIMELLNRDAFDIRFFSFLEKCLKAENNGIVFKRAIKAANVPPENILFIDDREINIAMAKKHGMRTFHFYRERTFSHVDNFSELVKYFSNSNIILD